MELPDGYIFTQYPPYSFWIRAGWTNEELIKNGYLVKAA